jgi:hypothetical protein
MAKVVDFGIRFLSAFTIAFIYQGCQIFHAATYQNGKNIPNNQKIYIPNGHKIYQNLTTALAFYEHM